MKPESMSNREWFIKKIAVNNNIPEKTVLAIINHQFQALSQNLQTNDTLEVSGFGKFIFNRGRAIKRLHILEVAKLKYIKTIEDLETSALILKNTKVRLIDIERAIISLKEKLYGVKQSI